MSGPRRSTSRLRLCSLYGALHSPTCLAREKGKWDVGRATTRRSGNRIGVWLLVTTELQTSKAQTAVRRRATNPVIRKQSPRGCAAPESYPLTPPLSTRQRKGRSGTCTSATQPEIVAAHAASPLHLILPPGSWSCDNESPNCPAPRSPALFDGATQAVGSRVSPLYHVPAVSSLLPVYRYAYPHTRWIKRHSPPSQDSLSPPLINTRPSTPSCSSAPGSEAKQTHRHIHHAHGVPYYGDETVAHS